MTRPSLPCKTGAETAQARSAESQPAVARTGGFGKERRVRKSAEYREIQRMGRRVSCPHFVLIVAPGSSRGGERNAASLHARLGVTASRRIGNAVQRNRMKRLVREAFRQFPDVTPAGSRLVVVCKRFDAQLKTQQVIAQWKAAAPRVRRALDGTRAGAKR